MASVMAFQGRCWQKEKSASDNILAKQLPIPFHDVRFKSEQQLHSLLEFFNIFPKILEIRWELFYLRKCELMEMKKYLARSSARSE